MSRDAIGVAQHDGPLRHGSVGAAHLSRIFDPRREASSKPASLELASLGPIRTGSEEAKLNIVPRQEDSCPCHARQRVSDLAEGKKGEPRGDEINAVARPEPGSHEIDHAVRAGVGNDSHFGPLVQ